MQRPYLARFESPGLDFSAAAIRWSGGTFPALWWRLLREQDAVDTAIRRTSGSEEGLLLLTSDSKDALAAEVTRLLQGAMPGTTVARSAIEFDAMTSLGGSSAHLRAHFDGFASEGRALGCVFRLYTHWVSQGLAPGVSYQLALRRNAATAERARRVRKYLAWLELELPFTQPVREVQRSLASRLLEPVWLADEYLLFRSAADREQLARRIGTHFSATTERIGFPEPPLESGDFSGWLSTGCHSTRDLGVSGEPVVEGASAFDEGEINWLMQQSVTSGASAAPGRGRDVFISYASQDFQEADAIRANLERDGRGCWIAPRDINIGGLPYTEAIPRAIEKARVVVVIVSRAASLSVHIPRELDLALAHRKPIVPLRLESAVPEGQLQYLLRTCQWLDLFGRDRNEAMSELSHRFQAMGLA